MKYLILSPALFFSITVYAAVDYTCMNNCSSQGYQYQYCKEACSFSTSNNSYQAPSFAESYAAGARAAAEANESAMRARILGETETACKQGDQQACHDLRMMLFNKRP